MTLSELESAKAGSLAEIAAAADASAVEALRVKSVPSAGTATDEDIDQITLM